MRNLSDKRKQARIKQLKILIGNYTKALANAKDAKTKQNLEMLIRKAKNDIEAIK
jgi:hypothetical protein